MKFERGPWPRKGTKVFDASGDWWHNACLNTMANATLAYALGYKLAADAVVQHVEEHRRYQDFLVYPVVFLYRHYIEIRLKEIVTQGSILLASPKRAPKTHNLQNLWGHARRTLEELSLGEPVEDSEAVEELIGQFHEVDPSSTAFRYPRDTRGHGSVCGMQTVNLRHVATLMKDSGAYLDAACDWIAEYLSRVDFGA